MFLNIGNPGFGIVLAAMDRLHQIAEELIRLYKQQLTTWDLMMTMRTFCVQ